MRRTHLFPCSTEGKKTITWFCWSLIPPSHFEIPLWLCLQVGCESLAKVLLALEQLSVQPAHLWRGWIEAGVGELLSSRLTGATNKIEAMLDQQPKTNQVKQQPATQHLELLGKCDETPGETEGVFYCDTHQVHTFTLIQVCLVSVV